LELGHHVSQESGVGRCHFLEFSKVGGNLAGDTQGCFIATSEVTASRQWLPTPMRTDMG